MPSAMSLPIEYLSDKEELLSKKMVLQPGRESYNSLTSQGMDTSTVETLLKWEVRRG